MKVLLLGEYSGFFKNLKLGFQANGCDVVHAAGGDGWKKIEGVDINLDSHKNGILRKVSIFLKYLLNYRKFKDFDLVIIINPSFFKKGIGRIVFNYIRNNNKKIFLSACGDDVEYITYGLSGNFKFWPFQNWKEDSIRSDYFQTPRERSIHSLIAGNVDRVVPTAYDYRVAWMNSIYADKVSETIPLPIKIADAPPSFKMLSDKIVFFHGLNREGFKGTHYIRKALEKLKENFPNDVEVVIDGNMPLEQYLKLLKKVDVVLDQCKVYSFGSMNTLYSLSMGKLVMSGAQVECLKDLNLIESPVVCLEPDEGQIYSQLVKILEEKNSLDQKRYDGYNYLIDNHSTEYIAQRYIDLYMEEN